MARAVWLAVALAAGACRQEPPPMQVDAVHAPPPPDAAARTPEASTMSSFECEFVRVEPDGRITVRRAGVEASYAPYPLILGEPPSPKYAEFVAHRLGRSDRPVRCETRPPSAAGTPRAQLVYFVMQDKSGDIWMDIADELVDAGLAKREPSPAPPPSGHR